MRKVFIQIVGAPIVCNGSIKDSWRDTSNWVSGQLRQRYGDNVMVQYYDLFDPACPSLPVDAHLPLVLVNGEVLSSGGKISVPALSQKIEYFIKDETS